MTKKQRQKEHQQRQMIRDIKLNQKRCKLEAAKDCFDKGLEHYRRGDTRNVLYWEYEYRRNILEAGSVRMEA